MINKATFFTLIFIAFLALPASAQISYQVDFPNAVHHEAEITMTLTGVPDGTLPVRMSRTSPGRYSLHEFAKNVYRVSATDGSGKILDISRPNNHQWDISGHDGTVTVKYTLYADRADGTYSQIDASHAHLNMPATFMFPRDLHNWPITVTFAPPADSEWKVASQLFETDDAMTYTAPDLQYFMDSPTELSNFSMRTWTVPRSEGSKETYEMRLAIHHIGTEAEVDNYADMVRRVVDQQNAVYGGPPAFETGSYTFIADYLPWASGDGMEHRNSTILTSSSSLERNAIGLLGTVSHEYFHAWNVERIRPAALEPFDFEAANMSPDLWFAEGFTSYYTPLFIRRAGITSDADYARAISGGLSFVINSPARNIFNPTEMSMNAPFADRASSSVDPLNFANTFISYYTWGAVIGLNL
ncbi:MAG: peptidase M61, partial [Rhodothermales bacterium]